MKLIDYFFFKTYSLLMRFKNDPGDAKWSAILFTGLIVSISMLSLVCLSGIIYDNPISKLLKISPFLFWMSAFILSPIIISIRYYKYCNIESIRIAYDGESKTYRLFINAILILLLIAMPIITFILFRLYVIGSIKW